MPNMKALSLRINGMANDKVIQTWIKSHGQGNMFKIYGTIGKGVVIRNTHAKYKIPIFKDVKCMAQCFKKRVKGHGQGHNDLDL